MRRRLQMAILFLALVITAGFCIEQPTQVSADTVKTTTSSKTKVSNKTVNLKKKAKKTKKVKKTSTVKKQPVIVTSNTKKVVQQVTVKTTKTTVDKKGSKKRKINTKVVTTTKKTITTFTNTTKATRAVSLSPMDSVAAQVDDNIVAAFEKLGFQVVINSNASATGNFNPNTRTITLKENKPDVLLHEMGHFLSFLATSFPKYEAADATSEFENIYKAEKSLFTGANKTYVTKNVHEYFAESFKDYCKAPNTLKNQRPKTYAYIKSVVNSINGNSVETINAWYGWLWK